MIFTLVLWILSIPLALLTYAGQLINFIIPTWLNETITNIIGGSGVLNTVFPMYPHPGMAGLAGQVGIMTLFGWLVLLMGYLIILSLAYKLIKIFIGVLPWHTGGANIQTGGK